MLKAGMTWEVVKDMIGNKPYTSGIGMIERGENTKMKPAQCAMKRAEADALKRRFDVPFGAALADVNDEVEAESFAGEWAIDGSEVTDHDDESNVYTAAEFYIDANKAGFTKQQADEFMNESGAMPDMALSLMKKKQAANTLAKNKKQLGRDDTGL